MTDFKAGNDVWEAIRDLTSESNSRTAAVSYVSNDSVVKFAENDLLVVDASEDTVRGGQTSARVIQRALNRGACVVSIPRLHAKVMLFDSTAVVGSANISLRSRRHLTEAVVFSRQRKLVKDANDWIREIADTGTAIDDETLEHLLSIESERPPIKRQYRNLGESHIVFFKQVMRGDIEKYRTRSSTAGSGGGARDIRVSPANVFRPLLSQMLSEADADPRATHGRVLSRVGRHLYATEVKLWRPTDSRSNELRISRFYEVPGWDVSDDKLAQATERGGLLFYVLEMDVNGTVTAKVLTDRQLRRTNQRIGAHIDSLRAASGRRRSIVGAVDVVRGVAVP